MYTRRHLGTTAQRDVARKWHLGWNALLQKGPARALSRPSHDVEHPRAQKVKHRPHPGTVQQCPLVGNVNVTSLPDRRPATIRRL